MNRQEITAAVKARFRKKIPNGYTLGWDEARHYASFTKAVLPYELSNQTTFDYSFCNTFAVDIAGERGNHHWRLTIQLSFILPVYCVYWNEYQSTGQQFASASPEDRQALEQRARKTAESLGFTEFPSEWHDDPVEGVSLELADAENVTLYKCLFLDHA